MNAEIGSLAKPHGRHEGAILLYSGGVDSTHALIQYANGALGRRSVPLKQALLVEGADVSLDEEALWATTLKHAEAILSRFAVPLASVRTNVRALCGDWEDSHGCVLAACAWPWQSVSSTLVVAGSIHPENLANAWGSHPVSDHLLSLPHFEVTTDSLTRSRAEKISKLCDYSEILNDLRYCYSQKADELNCGQCRKCTFTKLAFLACGADIGRPRLNRVLALASAPDWLWAEAQDVLDLAKAKGNTHHIAIRLLKCLSFLKKGC